MGDLKRKEIETYTTNFITKPVYDIRSVHGKNERFIVGAKNIEFITLGFVRGDGQDTGIRYIADIDEMKKDALELFEDRVDAIIDIKVFYLENKHAYATGTAVQFLENAKKY